MTVEVSVGKKELEKKKHMQPRVEVIIGPMFSGKSYELRRRLITSPYAGLKVQAFKPGRDNRRGEDTINTQDGESFPAISVLSAREILDYVQADTDIVGIDEAQFLDKDLVSVCDQLVRRGKLVIVAGLEKNFRGEPFGPMQELLLQADHVDTFHAYCAICGEPASWTQRIKIVDGERVPADYNDPLVLIGATEAYESRCRLHHEVPGKPER